MGTRKPGHDHGFEELCTTSCDGYVPSKPIDRGEFGMPGLGIAPGRIFPVLKPVKVRLTAEGMMLDYGEEGEMIDAMTDDASFILTDVLPHLLGKFLKKNAQYARAQTGHDLGIKGIIPDINRKSAALITRIWDGQEGIEGGDVDTAVDLAEDLVGHLLLLLAKTRSA